MNPRKSTIELLSVGTDTAQLEIVRTLFHEYQDELSVDLCFQRFPEEIASLPGAYQSPNGGLLLALVEGRPAGCIAWRPIKDGRSEMKRLFVRPEHRKLGIGKLLIEACMRGAKGQGYQTMVLDTLERLSSAIGLYLNIGFKEIPPYNDNELDGVKFFACSLT